MQYGKKVHEIEYICGPKFDKVEDDSEELYELIMEQCMHIIGLLNLVDEIRNTTASEYGVTIYNEACKLALKWYNIMAPKINFANVDKRVDDVNPLIFYIKLLKDRANYLWSTI